MKEMSYAELIVFDHDKAKPYMKFSNHWGVAPMVWDMLIAKYWRSIAGVAHGFDLPWEELWKADIRIRRWERIVLHWTYDYVVAGILGVSELADALDMFHEAYSGGVRESHLANLAIELRAIWGTYRFQRESGDPGNGQYTAVALRATSTNPSPWHVYQNDEEGRPYDLSKDSKHTWLNFAGRVSRANQPCLLYGPKDSSESSKIVSKERTYFG
jgi:hypothetical protein